MNRAVATQEPDLTVSTVTIEDGGSHLQWSLPVLTRQMREGSDPAWLEFHRRYYLPLLRYAASRALNFDDALEIVQQTYLRIARHIRPFHDETDFWRWLACLTRCTVVDHRRGVARRAALLEKFAHWQENRQFDTATRPPVERSLAQEALARLAEEDAHLLRLKYYEGWSVQQIADHAGATPKAMENRLARLRQQMRELIMRMR